MRRRAFVGGIAALAGTAVLPAGAQTPPLRVAWVSTDRKSPASPVLVAFEGGMRDLGYVAGKNLVLDTWWGDGSGKRLEEQVPDILRSKPDVVLAQGGAALGAMIRAGVKLPIVFSVSADPVEAKFVASYARPGGNMTGISLFTLALVGKRMELVRELVPGVRRIAVVANPQHPGQPLELDAARAAAGALNLQVRFFAAGSAAELEAALADIARARDDAVIAFADGFTMGFASRFAEFAVAHRIPTVDGWAQFAQAGNVMTYGPVSADVYRRLASYVDRIHKGAKPGELPVELPTKVELVLNLKAARALGIAVPQSLLLRADEVIQ